MNGIHDPAPPIRVELSIERLSASGEGIGTYEGRAIFVEGGLPGERLRVEVQPSGKIQRGKLVELLTTSSSRRSSPCALSDRCGGCDWLHLEEAAQREAKQEIVLSALEHLGQIDRGRFQLLPTLVSPRQMAYRRRAVMHFEEGALCFYGRRSHRPVAVNQCPAMVSSLTALPGQLSPLLARVAGDIESVYLLSCEAHASFALELKGRIRPIHLELADKAVRQLGLRGAVIIPRQGLPQIVGKPVLKDESQGKDFALYLRPDTFAQANGEMGAELARCVAAAVGPRQRVLELFSGAGHLTFAVAAQSEEVLAVESSSASVELARRGARDGRVTNARFIQADVTKTCKALIAEGIHFDAIVADPPRTGAAGIGVWSRRLGARKVVYVGCDAGSLARDAADLNANGFAPKTLQLLDMFPQTRHVETVMTFGQSTSPEADPR